MRQISLRVGDELAAAIADEAERRGLSVNAWLQLLARAALDPASAGGEAERLRERLRRAGLLDDEPEVHAGRVDPEALARARSAAGAGTPLSDLVIEGRGPR